MKTSTRIAVGVLCLVSLLMAGSVFAAAPAPKTDPLAERFANPPDAARPHTWWHWMNGNITREGITADLEAMKRVGIGGAQVFNVSERIPEGPVAYMSPQWLDLMHHAVKEAGRLGIEICFHNCAGWSSNSFGACSTQRSARSRPPSGMIACRR